MFVCDEAMFVNNVIICDIFEPNPKMFTNCCYEQTINDEILLPNLARVLAACICRL